MSLYCNRLLHVKLCCTIKYMKKLRVTKGLTVGSIIILICFLLIGPFVYFSFFYVPTTLYVDSYLHDEKINNEHKMVVNYTKNDAIKYKGNMDAIVDTVFEQLNTEKNLSSVIMEVIPLNQHYVLIQMDNVIGYHDASFIFNLDSNRAEQGLQFSDAFINMVRQGIIDQARLNSAYNSMAFSSDFALNLENYVVEAYIEYDAPMMQFNIDLGLGWLSYSVDMRYHIEDINIDLQLDSINQSIPYRLQDSPVVEAKIIYLGINHAFNRTLDYQWIDLFSTYRQSMSFIVNGAKLQGNKDLVIESLNQGMGLVNGTYQNASFDGLSETQIDHELFGTVRLIEEITNFSYTTKLLSGVEIDDNNYFNLINPTVIIDSLDQLTLEFWQNLATGSVVYLEDGRSDFLNAMQSLLPELMDAGIQVRAINEIR